MSYFESSIFFFLVILEVRHIFILECKVTLSVMITKMDKGLKKIKILKTLTFKYYFQSIEIKHRKRKYYVILFQEDCN